MKSFDRETCFFYHRNDNYDVTVAYRRRDDNSVAYGAAFCAPDDQFVKSRGRQIAIGRIASSLNVSDAQSRADVHEVILNHIRGFCDYAPNGFCS